MSHQIAQCTILLQCPASHLKLDLALKRKGNKEGFPEEPRVEGAENVDNTSRIGFHSLGETNVIWTPHVPPAKQGTMEKIRWWVWVLYCNFSPLDYAKRPALWTAVTSGNQCPQSAPFCDKRFSATSPGVPRCSQVCPCPPSTLSHGKWKEDRVCKKDGGRKRVVAPAVDVTSSGAFVTEERVLRCFTKEAISATVRWQWYWQW